MFTLPLLAFYALEPNYGYKVGTGGAVLATNLVIAAYVRSAFMEVRGFGECCFAPPFSEVPFLRRGLFSLPLPPCEELLHFLASDLLTQMPLPASLRSDVAGRRAYAGGGEGHAEGGHIQGEGEDGLSPSVHCILLCCSCCFWKKKDFFVLNIALRLRTHILFCSHTQTSSLNRRGDPGSSSSCRAGPACTRSRRYAGLGSPQLRLRSFYRSRGRPMRNGGDSISYEGLRV